MVDPDVFEFVGYDPEEWIGLRVRAAGSSASRCSATASPTSRLLWENDLRVLGQF